MYFVCMQFLFWECSSDDARLMLVWLFDVFERMGYGFWVLGCHVWLFLKKLNVELVSCAR